MSKLQNHQVIRPIGKPLTEEEKKNMIIKELMDKRERFALNIMHGLCSNPELLKEEADAKKLADFAVITADALLERLYPLEEEKPKEEKEK